MLEIDPAVDSLKQTTYRVEALADDIARAAQELRYSAEKIVDYAVDHQPLPNEDGMAMFPPVRAADEALRDTGEMLLNDVLRALNAMARDVAP